MTVSVAPRVRMLPPLARAYLGRALLTDAGPVTPAQVRITQTGEMWLKPGGRTMRFRADQHYAVDRISFRWEARFSLGLRVTDSYRNGEGRLRVRLLGLPIQNTSGHDATVAEAYRYLAELCWVPHAIAANPDLEWRAVDDRFLEVATRVAGERLALTLRFDERGDIVACHSAARPRGAGQEPAPWGGELGDYQVLGDIRVPTRAEVYWELPEGRYTYWHGQITSIEELYT